jgi:beta-lactamase regulating signal transducer with metallopeptidase domain
MNEVMMILVIGLKSSLIVVLAWMLACAMQKFGYSARARHRLWLATFASLVLLPLGGALLPTIELSAPMLSSVLAAPDLSQPGLHLPNTAMSAWVYSLYGTGVVLLLLHFMLARAALARIWQRARAFEAPDFDQLKVRLGLSKHSEIRLAQTSSTPMTWGSRMLLPANAREWPRTRLHHVLLHECCHQLRADSMSMSLATLIRAAYWFNPLIWLALKALEDAQEHACDEQVLALGAERIGYAQTLLEIASERGFRQPANAGSAMAAGSQLKSRMLAILADRRVHELGRVPAVVLSALLITAVYLVFVTEPIDPQRRLAPLTTLSALEPLTPLAPLSKMETTLEELVPE